MTDPVPQQPTETIVVDKKSFPWWLLLVALAGWLLASFFGYSLKQTKEKLIETHKTASSGVTIYSWKEVAGKAYPVTIFKSNTETNDTSDKEKTVTIWKSGVSLGLAVSAQGHKAGTIAADLIPFGPGTIQVTGLVSPSDQWAGVAYRLLF